MYTNFASLLATAVVILFEIKYKVCSLIYAFAIRYLGTQYCKREPLGRSYKKDVL